MTENIPGMANGQTDHAWKIDESNGNDADLWPEGVRPADNTSMQNLMGGDDEDESFGNQDYEGNAYDTNKKLGKIG